MTKRSKKCGLEGHGKMIDCGTAAEELRRSSGSAFVPGTGLGLSTHQSSNCPNQSFMLFTQAQPPYQNQDRAGFERLIRRLLNYPNRPAVILFNGYRWTHTIDPRKGTLCT